MGADSIWKKLRISGTMPSHYLAFRKGVNMAAAGPSRLGDFSFSRAIQIAEEDKFRVAAQTVDTFFNEHCPIHKELPGKIERAVGPWWIIDLWGNTDLSRVGSMVSQVTQWMDEVDLAVKDLEQTNARLEEAIGDIRHSQGWLY